MRKKGKKREFHVKWENYPENQATWEPEENMIDCHDLIKAFEDTNGSSSKVPSSSRKKRAAPADAESDAKETKKVRKESAKRAAPTDVTPEPPSNDDQGGDEQDLAQAAEEEAGDDVPDITYLKHDELPKEIHDLPTWDGLVELEHMEQNPDEGSDGPDADRNPIVYVMWKEGEGVAGQRSRHSSKDLIEKAPKMLLQYLLNHIKFRERKH
ncbi:hypothetical protein M427DRAFT_302747 [Gonapodya prolifera JEL478]|uniref:Chromo domain-containing protein n=1 Tax=Gonapodya prolifera (strain JEL478) TaxID=1344416 RepID=A0A139AIH5_GONPJ|nr:hypothetical protein M427DRAFT_302747 [Gonapodya prolifera JEL478]|eukprot:KXS16215.1 hypothetical protein M427DRAFT_302747 [Gonapodya prolifera JEL478]